MDICEAPLNTIAFSKALRYGKTQCYLQTSHTCLYSPAAEHHRPLAGTHFTVPQRVEGWVDLVSTYVVWQEVISESWEVESN